MRMASVAALALLYATDARSAEVVSYRGEEPQGSVVIMTKERSLYLVLGEGKARRYRVGVGKAGKQWQGTTRITGKYLYPAWGPTPEVRRDNPALPEFIPGGSPRNPLGVAALALERAQYAIHGTNAPHSIGNFVSYGCIRMHNRDVLDLFGRVSVGARVVVLP